MAGPSETVRLQCKELLDQIEIFRILLKEMSAKLSNYEQTLMELEHYAEEGFYGGKDGE